MAYTTINDFGRIARAIPATTAFARLSAILRAWRQRARARDELARLTARDARDLGLDPGIVAYEASKPFWRA